MLLSHHCRFFSSLLLTHSPIIYRPKNLHLFNPTKILQHPTLWTSVRILAVRVPTPINDVRKWLVCTKTGFDSQTRSLTQFPRDLFSVFVIGAYICHVEFIEKTIPSPNLTFINIRIVALTITYPTPQKILPPQPLYKWYGY